MSANATINHKARRSPWRAYNTEGKIVAACETFHLAMLNASIEAEKNGAASVGAWSPRPRIRGRR